MKAIEKSYQIRENIATNRKKSIRGRKKVTKYGNWLLKIESYGFVYLKRKYIY